MQKSYQNVNALNNIKETFILAIVYIGTTPANGVCDCQWHDHLTQLKLVTFLHYVPEERYSKTLTTSNNTQQFIMATIIVVFSQASPCQAT